MNIPPHLLFTTQVWDTACSHLHPGLGDILTFYLYNSRWSPGGRKATSRSTGSGEASAAAIDSIILPTSLSSPPDETETYLVRARARARLRARVKARAREGLGLG